MHLKNEKGGLGARKRLGPVIKVAAVLLAIVLVVVAGVRLHAWHIRGEEARLTTLVNPWNRMDAAEYTPRLTGTENGLQVDKSCRRALEQMLSDCAAAGCEPRLTAGYRSREEQQALFDAEVERQLAAWDNSRPLAEEAAARLVARPGTSEHELGLAVHIEGEAAQGWLRENAWRYGFILRYPQGGEAFTGMAYDPAHYRYVGQAAAEQIDALGITLEEFMGMFYSDTAEIIFE